jgi:hypothetical protein
VSEAVGTQINIDLWFLAMASWFRLFVVNLDLQDATVRPRCFPGNAFNFLPALSPTLCFSCPYSTGWGAAKESPLDAD